MKFFDIHVNLSMRVLLIVFFLGFIITGIVNSMNLDVYNKYQFGFGLSFILMGFFGLLELWFMKIKIKRFKKKKEKASYYDAFKVK